MRGGPSCLCWILSWCCICFVLLQARIQQLCNMEDGDYPGSIVHRRGCSWHVLWFLFYPDVSPQEPRGRHSVRTSPTCGEFTAGRQKCKCELQVCCKTISHFFVASLIKKLTCGCKIHHLSLNERRNSEILQRKILKVSKVRIIPR